MHTSCMSLDVGHGSLKENVHRNLQPQGGCRISKSILRPYDFDTTSITDVDYKVKYSALWEDGQMGAY